MAVARARKGHAPPVPGMPWLTPCRGRPHPLQGIAWPRCAGEAAPRRGRPWPRRCRGCCARHRGCGGGARGRCARRGRSPSPLGKPRPPPRMPWPHTGSRARRRGCRGPVATHGEAAPGGKKPLAAGAGRGERRRWDPWPASGCCVSRLLWPKRNG
jgi:hypothetical protein